MLPLTEKLDISYTYLLTGESDKNFSKVENVCPEMGY